MRRSRDVGGALVVGALVVGALTAGCDAGGPDDPQGVTVELVLVGFDTSEARAPLRYAVGWTFLRAGGYGLWVTDDGPVDLDAPSQLVPVSVPPPERRDDLYPTERLLLGYVNSEPRSTLAYRPRFIVYEDVDDNGRFDADLLDRTGPDRVLGVEDQPARLAYIVDVESVFRKLPFSRTESFYLATDDRFTSFVRVTDSGGVLDLAPWDPMLYVTFDDSAVPSTSIACFRPVPVSATTRTVVVDDSVDAAICGLELGACDQTALSAVTVPELPDPEASESDSVAQCRQRDGLEALVIGTASTECEDCACTRHYDEQVYVVASSAAPSWWPCGDVLEICEEDADAFAAYSVECAAKQRDELDDDSAAGG